MVRSVLTLADEIVVYSLAMVSADQTAHWNDIELIIINAVRDLVLRDYSQTWISTSLLQTGIPQVYFHTRKRWSGTKKRTTNNRSTTSKLTGLVYVRSRTRLVEIHAPEHCFLDACPCYNGRSNDACISVPSCMHPCVVFDPIITRARTWWKRFEAMVYSEYPLIAGLPMIKEIDTTI